MKREKARTFRVGLFVFFGIVLSAIAVFTIGENRKAWDRKVTYHAAYDDVVGLRTGSVVRMGGIDIGSVGEVEHGKDPNDNKVYVTLSIAKAEMGRIRAGTVATIEAKGLLGDKMVVIAWDQPRAEKMRAEGKDPNAAVAPDGWLDTAPPGDLFGDAQKAAQEAKAALSDIKRVTEGIADDRFKEDLHGTMSSLRLILDGVALRDGVAHKMIFDPEEAKKVERILGNLEATSANLARVSRDANELTTQIKNGNGLAHAAIYDDKLAQATTGSMIELNKSLEAVRTGNGLAHAIVYGDDQTQHLMGNVNAMSDDLREIVAGMKAGRGTVGALLVDPSVYEDIKLLVGNVERNQVLRALVRYSIKQNEERSPEPPPPAKAK
ncbi:MAG: MCE family protein [Labilithrix sp.]|nr:MCE family protein [Labilithrix sp.]MCW5812938.1 MCE family protein [Labilithrix sp.]